MRMFWILLLAGMLGGCASQTFHVSRAEALAELEQLYPPRESPAGPNYDSIVYTNAGDDTTHVTITRGRELLYDRTEIAVRGLDPSRTKVSVQAFQDGPWATFPQRDFARERAILKQIGARLGPIQTQPRLTSPATQPADAGKTAG